MKTIFSLTLIIFFLGMLGAQPQLSTVQTIEGVKVYRDYKKSETYYYTPGDLHLATKTGGEPHFKLVQLRYTGTFATGDQGETRFMNIVQFTVRMDLAERDQLLAVKSRLGKNAKLRPMPIRNVEAYMVAPFGGKYKRIGQSGSLEGEDSLGESDNTSYWTERTFTLRLENHEAELLWNMVQKGQLAISVNYAFFADALNDHPSEVKLRGKSAFEEQLGDRLEDLIRPDTAPSLQIIKADAFPIEIDAEKYNHLLIREDIDAGIPPAYPALEVKCYDFSDELRPDLAIKAIEVEATGVSGYPIKLKPYKFVRSRPDQNTHQIRFPYAVKMDKPFRYRVREYGADGSVEPYSDWIIRDSWTGWIDITTKAAENNFNKRLVEFETDISAFEEKGIQKMKLYLVYFFKNEPKEMSLTFSPEQNLPLQQLNVVHDKGTTVQCIPIWTFEEDTSKEGEVRIVAEDNYVYLNVPEDGN